MNTATATSAAKIIRLKEDLSSVGAPGRVDRAKGVIYGVKVLGAHSKNTHKIPGAARTTYTFEAMRNAVPFYESLQVNVDHSSRSNHDSERSARDRIGWLTNPRVTEDGIFADLNLSKTDPFSEKVFEAAERNPALFSLSHNAMGRWELRGDTAVILEITEVRSVDIVADGGSVSSLFESHKTKLKEAGDEMPDDMGMAAPPVNGGSDPMDALGAIIGEFLKSKTPEHYEIAKKIMAMLKPETATAEQDEPEPPAKKDKGTDMEEQYEEDDEATKKMKESLAVFAAENELLKRRFAVLEEAREAKVELTPAKEKALLALSESADRKALLEELRQRPNYTSYAKSVGSLPTSSTTGDFEKTYKNAIQRITGRPSRS